jgi:hypothetical protein
MRTMESFVKECYQEITFTERPELTTCKECDDATKKNRVPMYGHANLIDPFWTPNDAATAAFRQLPKLSEIEVMLIALRQPIMKVYRLKSGSCRFEGNIINFCQEIGDIAAQLPRSLESINILIVRRCNGNSPEKFRDFKISRSNVLQWLMFLCRHNRYYSHINLQTTQDLTQ